MKNIVIMEDSSKHKFGGGQRVTIDVINSLSIKYNLYLIDCKKNSLFKDIIKDKITNIINTTCYGSVKKGNKSSFSFNFLEILIMPLTIIYNFFIIAFALKKYHLKSIDTILYSANKKMLIMSWLLNKVYGYKYIYHAHGYDDKKSIFFKTIEIPIKTASIVLCVSNLIRKNYDYPNCVTFYNAVNLSQESILKKIETKEKIIVASFSSLIKIKGIEYFINSYNYLKNKQKVEYWIFGTGEEESYLENFTNASVKLKGFNDDVSNTLKNSVDILVLPSIVEEACPMIVLESFVYGIPVITTNIGGQSELVENNKLGFKVPIKNESEIAKYIDKLIENYPLYLKLSNNAKEYVKFFSIERYNENLNKIIDKEFDDITN